MLPLLSQVKAMIAWRQRDAKVLIESGLFEPEFYAAQVNESESPNLNHFLKKGWKRGADPSRFFDTKFYLRTNSDVRIAGWNPVMHYIRHGWREGRIPHPDFHADRYITDHPQIDFTAIDPLQHCVQQCKSIKWTTYASPIHATTHYFQSYEPSQLGELFDAEYYSSMYPDVKKSGLDPFHHYSLYGWRLNYNPSPEFDTWFFLRNYPEFIGAQASPLHQYIRAGMPSYWKLRSPNSVTLDPVKELQGAKAFSKGSLRLAVHVHAFYPEFIEEAHCALQRVRTPFDLFVTTCAVADERFICSYLAQHNSKFDWNVRVVENRGRDIGPMMTEFPQMWNDYDIVAHLHSKKSSHTEFGDDWRRFALAQMFGNSELVKTIMCFLERNEEVGFFFPDNYCKIKKYMDLDNNTKLIDSILESAKLPKLQRPKIEEFAAGSMAWFRTVAFRPLINAFAKLECFDVEQGQIDATIAHAMEHAFPLVARAQGFRSICYYLKRCPQLDPK
jgi:hypothetical protein